jgi:hypothetical protein
VHLNEAPDPLNVGKFSVSGASIPIEARCSRCRENRPLGEFAVDKVQGERTQKHLQSVCDRAKAKHYYVDNLEEARLKRRDAGRRRRDRLSEERGPYRLRRSYRAP